MQPDLEARIEIYASLYDLDGPTLEIRVAAKQRLSKMAPSLFGIREMCRALRDAGPYMVRAGAALALGRWGYEARAARGELCRALLLDKNVWVRDQAAVALGRIGCRYALRSLEEAAATDEAQVVRASAVISIQQIEKRIGRRAKVEKLEAAKC